MKYNGITHDNIGTTSFYGLSITTKNTGIKSAGFFLNSTVMWNPSSVDKWQASFTTIARFTENEVKVPFKVSAQDNL